MPRGNKRRGTAMAEVKRQQRLTRLSQIEPDLIIMPNLNLDLFLTRESELAALHGVPDIVGRHYDHGPMIVGMDFVHHAVNHFMPCRMIVPMMGRESLWPGHRGRGDEFFAGMEQLAYPDINFLEMTIRMNGTEMIEKIIKDIEAESGIERPDDAFSVFMGKYKK